VKGIFTPFYKVDTDESRKLNANGNGLGLSICKNIAKCLNGDLTVSSEWGIGSIFILKIEAENCGEIMIRDPSKNKMVKDQSRKRLIKESSDADLLGAMIDLEPALP
jgi:osomolarity two-component system sensor histidine kinase SLN1